MTARDVLTGCLVALTIVAAPGLAGMLGQAVTGVPDLPPAVSTPAQVGEAAPVWTKPRTPMREASRSRQPARTGTLTDTTCYVWTGHRTASGLWPRVGMAASNHHPFGTRLYVQTIGTVTVTDRIGHGSDLDLFMTDRAACLRFGRQQLRVTVTP